MSSLYGGLSPQRLCGRTLILEIPDPSTLRSRHMREGMAYHVRLFGEKPHSVIHDISGVHDIVVDFVPFRSEFVVPVTLPLHLE